jgi:hypothetical protein
MVPASRSSHRWSTDYWSWLRDRLDVRYGTARLTPEGTVGRLRGQAGHGPVWPPVARETTEHRRCRTGDVCAGRCGPSEAKLGGVRKGR